MKLYANKVLSEYIMTDETGSSNGGLNLKC